METITNITNAAAKAVWGDTEANKEPVSGVKGNTAQGEPYDAGNLDTPAQEKVEQNYESSSRDTGLGSTVSDSNRTGTLGTDSSAVPTASSTTPNKDNNTATSTGLGGATTASSLPTTKDTRDTTAGQNDTRDPDDVDTSSSSGPGNSTSVLGHEPRTINEIAKSNGGDAGRDGSNESFNNRPSEGVAKSSGEGAGLGSTAETEDQERKEEVLEPVHATGLAADGGNFDATKPGAGQEAERLMEEKGIHASDSGSHGSATKSHSSHDDKKDKPSLGERIKAKLHKH